MQWARTGGMMFIQGMKLSRSVFGLLLWHAGLASAQDLDFDDKTFDETIGEFSTDFKTAGEDNPRAANVKMIADKLDGIVLLPGEKFSYNDVIGPRTKEAGFKKAHAIADKGSYKALVDSYGGGACQPASTLHAAVFYAGLKIDQATPHSLASAYIQPGLDATVSYKDIDLVFENDTNSSIKIDTNVEPIVDKKGKSTKSKLTVKLLSTHELHRHVTAGFKFSKRVPRQTWRLTSEAVKAPKVSQSGSDGVTIDRTYKVIDTDTNQVLVNEKKTFKFEPLVKIVLVPKPKPVDLEIGEAEVNE